MDLIRVLWIEDDAARQFDYMATPVLLDGRFDLSVAANASEGMEQLTLHGPFGVVIVDIRLPPGSDQAWQEFVQKYGSREDPCLGLEILRQIFWKGSDHKKFGPPVAWADDPLVFGVLTVENYWGQTRKCLETCGIKSFRSKTEDQGEQILLEMIEEIINRKGSL
jgi:hypothetical protein